MLVLPLAAKAEVKLPAVFSDHMVLQRDVVVPVWGWGAPGEKITVNFAGQSRATQAGADGKWSVTLSRLSRGDATTLIVQGTNTIMIDDVLVGEVGLGSGQATP